MHSRKLAILRFGGLGGLQRPTYGNFGLLATAGRALRRGGNHAEFCGLRPARGPIATYVTYGAFASRGSARAHFPRPRPGSGRCAAAELCCPAMIMVEAESLDALRSALVPVEALRGEQSELESWVRESFAALEALHDELSEWQRELAREQAELDQREAAVADAEAQDRAEGQRAADLAQQLTRAGEDARQLEEENAEQLQAIDDLERQLVSAQAELRAERRRTEELSKSLDSERERAMDEHRLWSGELRDMRGMLQRQCEMLESLGGRAGAAVVEDTSPACSRETDDSAPPTGTDAATRAAELRRRASSRRAQRRSP